MNREQLFDEIMKLLLACNKHINAYENLPRNYGTEEKLYVAECHTIAKIGDNPFISMAEIARQMKKTKSAVSQLVDRLVKKDLLRKEPHPDNNRTTILKLTEKGALVYRYHHEFDKKNYTNILHLLDDFSIRELQTYADIQKKINTQLKENIKLH